jgi:ferrous iron transport protein B
MDFDRTASLDRTAARRSIALVGHHNVGKSVLFTHLTGRQTITANYPGTTVEILRGEARFSPGTMVVDTPGVITLPPRTEDEYATARVLLHEPLQTIIQVGDAKNLGRTLLLTVQLAEMGVPLILALNMMDEADARGVKIDHQKLAAQLGLIVIPMIANRGQGIAELKQAAAPTTQSTPQFRLPYPEEIERALAEITPCLPAAAVAGRALALLWLSRDPVVTEWLEERLPGDTMAWLEARREALQLSFVRPLSTVIQNIRLGYLDRLTGSVLVERGQGWQGLASKLGHLATHPLWGLPILALVLYALFWFVGLFGAGTLVNLLETKLFAEALNPWIAGWVTRLAPVPFLADLLVGEYGLWTMGMTYALALILPIVTTFFLAFGFLEDTGYLPRLAVLSNRLFRLIGLNGKAVVPMILGLGCVTMATLTTRILETRRERLLAIMLLAVAIPCSAQLGIIMGLLAATSFTATLIWCGVVLGVLLLVGWLSARLIPGERTSLMVEIPPLRMPALSTVVIKTLARLEWYLKEVVPLFLVGTGIMFLLDRFGALAWLVRASEPLVEGWLGLPPEASTAFLMGFLRRDFGATGLFVLNAQGLLSPAQVVVAMVTVTLFIPCIASVFMIAKERGKATAVAITALVFPLAFLVGGLLNRTLALVGWGS